MLGFWLTKIAYADQATTNVKTFIRKVEILLINPLIILMFSVALIVFLYGVFEMLSGESNSETRTKGRTNMIYGVLGMFVMASVFGIMKVLGNTLGVDNTNYSTLP